MRVIYPGHVDEASLGVNLADEVGRGFGEHGVSRRLEREIFKASV